MDHNKNMPHNLCANHASQIMYRDLLLLKLAEYSGQTRLYK